MSDKTDNEINLSEWKDNMIEMAKKNLKNDGELVPLTILLLKDPNTGETTMVNMVMDMSSNMTKEMQSLKIRTICQTVDVYGLLFMSEAWMAKMDKDEVDDDLSNVTPPSQRDDKVEVLMCSFESQEHSEMKIFDMVRDEDDNISDFKERDNSDFSGFEGRFSNFLTKPT